MYGRISQPYGRIFFTKRLITRQQTEDAIIAQIRYSGFTKNKDIQKIVTATMKKGSIKVIETYGKLRY